MRITKEELRIPLRAILALSLLVLLSSLALTVFLALTNYIGFNLTTSSASLCNSYLTNKFEASNVEIYSLSFVSSILSNVSALALFVLLLVEVVRHSKSTRQSESPYNDFTFSKLAALYLLTSLTSLFLEVSLGYFLSLAVEKGACLGSVSSDWLIVVGLSGLSLTLALVMWTVVVRLVRKYGSLPEEEELHDLVAGKEPVTSEPAEEKNEMQNELQQMLFDNRRKEIERVPLLDKNSKEETIYHPQPL